MSRLPLSPLIPFGEWLPDQEGLNSPGSAYLLNVLPNNDRYRPLRSLQANTGALDDRCQGAISFKDQAGNVTDFTGDASKLYTLTSSTWSDVSVLGGYTTASEAFWDFTVYGDLVLATNGNDPIQYYNTSTSSAFANLNSHPSIIGTAPTAKSIAVVNNFVMALNGADPVDGDRYNRLWWSGLDAPTTWDPGTNQSDFQDIFGSGNGTKIIPYSNYGLIVMERGIWRADYVGTPLVFEIQQVVENIGTRYQGAIAWIGTRVFMLTSQGFYAFDGQQAIPIGEGRIDRYFFNDVEPSLIARTSASIDPVNRNVVWAYASANSNGVHPDKLLFYNWVSNRWTHAEIDTQFIYSGMSNAVSLEDLDAIYGDLDSVPFSLDSLIFQGGEPSFLGFDSTNKRGYFNGAFLEATLETTEAQLNQQGFATLTNVLPMVDSDSCSVKVFSRNTQGASLTESPYTPITSATEESDHRVTAKYHRARIKTSGEWTIAQGVRVRFSNKGSK